MRKKKHTKKIYLESNYTLIRIMNGEKISHHYFCRDLLMLYETNLKDSIYIVYNDLLKTEKIIEFLTDINQFNQYMRSIKINKIINGDLINYKNEIKLYLIYFIYENYNAITIIKEEKKI